MKLKSNSLAMLQQAAVDGYHLFALDTGDSGNDDTLYGFNAAEVRADVMFHHDLESWPAGWTLISIPPTAVFPKKPEQIQSTKE